MCHMLAWQEIDFGFGNALQTSKFLIHARDHIFSFYDSNGNQCLVSLGPSLIQVPMF